MKAVEPPSYFLLYSTNKSDTILPSYLIPSNFSPTILADRTTIGLTLLALLTAFIIPTPLAISTTGPEVSKNPGVSQRSQSYNEDLFF